ncbi:hypothetical protein OG978_44415 (plasmid) [Streptomyces sp. NBC_01591]|uniref:hypothetical protein n=1 Tax=Streptomyces sp. NBC_01591 TaxID=2975888 RepID=UPI002DDA302A|nr:hypothetical protein [Streptomyces sp. NBC_01591]WSD74165.1 hypothetical protein OG978_44415 [Streptomyces sp. NBC_01591]
MGTPVEVLTGTVATSIDPVGDKTRHVAASPAGSPADARSTPLRTVRQAGVPRLAQLRLDHRRAPARLQRLPHLQRQRPLSAVHQLERRHGTWQQIEGADLGGRQTVLLDDTARSGTSLLRSARLLRMGDARVGTAVCVLDRDAGAATLLADHHMVLRALVRDLDGAR